jgi:hypothetical protein
MKVQQQRVRRCAAQHSKDEASQQQRLSFCPVSEDTSMPYFRHDNTKHDPMLANIGPAPKWSSHAPITVVRLASTVAACSLPAARNHTADAWEEHAPQNAPDEMGHMPPGQLASNQPTRGATHAKSHHVKGRKQ